MPHLVGGGVRAYVRLVAVQVVTGGEGLKLVERLRPDVALVDVRMEGLDGVETARRLAVERPEVVTILVTAHKRSPVSGMWACGAIALIAKSDLRASLLTDLWKAFGTSSP